MERYESLGVVGEGSYGVVLKCRHRETGQIVAIKKFLESDEDQNVKKIALREVRMLKKLRHENLINLIEFFRRKRRLYLVFEYVDHTVLDELEANETGLEPEISKSHIFQVIRGVAFCHQNRIVHRDVKPENVLVSRLGVIKLCDFGFARQLEGPNESCTDYVATRWYRAPELLVGDTKYGREVDIWAIGCLLAEILSGDPLFPGQSDIDQLFHIIQTLGELSVSHKHLVDKNPMLANLRLPSAASTPLSSSFPKWSPRTLTFISECLDLTPPRRPTAEGLLKHDYFTHDNFPEKFLPDLMKKVQQEFSSNVLLQPGRKGSGQNERKNRKTKLESPQKQSFKYIASKNYQQKLSPQKQSYSQSVIHSTSNNQQERSIVNNFSTHSIASSVHHPMTTFSVNQSTFSNTGNQAQSSSHASSYQTQSIASSNRNQPYVPYSSIASVNPGARSGVFPYEDGGPVSLPFSHIPPIKETQQSNSNALSNLNIYSTSSVSHTSNLPTTSFHLNKNNSQTTLNLQLIASPTRSFRKDDRTRKSPQVIWPPTTKSNNLSVQGQNSIFSEQSTSKDINSIATDSNNHAASNASLTPISPFSRHHPFDFNRHPYAISLDRTKEPSSQKDNRDPLREIKDNGKDGRKESIASREANKDSRKQRKDVYGWAKPRLLNDDLYLPTVPGVYSKNPFSTSPKKSSRLEATSGERLKKGTVGKEKKSPGVLAMPFLSNLERGSASSTDSYDTVQAGSNLPYV